MKEKRFYIILALITLFTAIALFALFQVDVLKPFKGLFIGALIFFIILTIALYYISKRAAVHKNSMLFIYVMMFAIVIKFGFCLITLFLYNRLYAPTTNLYVLPFIGIYVIYTIFETYFMMILGKIRPKDVH